MVGSDRGEHTNNHFKLQVALLYREGYRKLLEKYLIYDIIKPLLQERKNTNY